MDRQFFAIELTKFPSYPPMSNLLMNFVRFKKLSAAHTVLSSQTRPLRYAQQMPETARLPPVGSFSVEQIGRF
ncbi:hypothetical protein AD947_05835 [Acetobacter tropicalis]|uniref:Uncharacterized protein n=1 Tax=Acetobacter tropicalis TaxID=104102 RepID=A0A149TZK8_9PROT|nr:hypothetical protein AD947_05835 [Acetobacter tropicalis]OUI86148.1 hypothetical protein HC62_07090 [Acetobacter tropicalis]